MSRISQIIDTIRFPIDDAAFRLRAAGFLKRDGALVLPGFITKRALEQIYQEAIAAEASACFYTQKHNVYLTLQDPAFSSDHPRNRQMNSSKGCICDDQVDQQSSLRILYDNAVFRQFLCHVLNEKQLYPYGDTRSSINIHFARQGQELGWHFDNSSFATTLLIAKPEGGGKFEYLKNIRDADAGENGYEKVDQILAGNIESGSLAAEPGTLMLFRGRNSIHKVTPTGGNKTRMLAVPAFNSEPDISLSESARMTFYGRLE